MELLESNSPKGELIKKSGRKKEELEREIKQLGQQTERMLGNALIVGGSLALTYMIVRRFTKKAKSKRKTKQIALVGHPEEEEQSGSVISSLVSEAGTVLATQATAFLLGMAREKLAEFMEAYNRKKKDEDEHS